MADEIEQARREVAATRDRIDRGLVELGAQLPNRDELVATATRVGAAIGATVVAVGGLVLYGKRRGADKARTSEARAYAEALVSALPEVAEAYVAARGTTAATPAPAAVTPADEDDDGMRGTVVTAALLAVGTVTGLVLARRSS